jgi:two-component system LytT family response regulator
MCLKFQPQILFLNPRAANGFDLLKFLPNAASLICVTEDDRFALRAFDAGALDYLLKPLLPERLSLALSRHAARNARLRVDTDSRVSLKSTTGYQFFSPSRISHILAQDHQTHVFLAEGTKITCHRSMQEWTCELAGHGFHRLDRTLIVNPSQICRMVSHSRNEATLSFNSGSACLKIGRIAIQRLRELSLFSHTA